MGEYVGNSVLVSELDEHSFFGDCVVETVEVEEVDRVSGAMFELGHFAGA